MNIGIIGATGNIGQRAVAEALRRGHRVTALARDPSRARTEGGEVTWRAADVTDAESVARNLDGLDVLVSAYGPGNASRDLEDTLRRSIQSPETFVAAAKALLKALEARPALRLIVVGGAGSLEVRPGVQLVDSPDQPAALRALGLPEEYRVAVLGHRDALNVFRLSDRNWTYFSPAMEIGPGERTGRFRLGGNQVVVGADGRSRISYEDYAVALLDEIELPRHVQRRFTIGY
jgi:putative NADH-flavin reductase